MLLPWIILNLLSVAVYANNEILIVIVSQNTAFHQQLGKNLRTDIIKQTHNVSPDFVVNVRLVHEIANYPGDWTILPVLPKLTTKANLINDNTSWVIFCDVNTHINLTALVTKLANEDHKKLTYLGYGLHDEEATIIHHFAFYQNPKWFPYPLLQAGVVFSVPLIKRLAALAVDRAIPRHTEFAIDAAHELARFIYDNIQANEKLSLTHIGSSSGNAIKGQEFESVHGRANTFANSQSENLENTQKLIMKRAAYICGTVKDANCAMYAAKLKKRKICAAMKLITSTRPQNIYFAIKTCSKFHKERLPIIKATWAKHAHHKRYFSDVSDVQIPTIRTGVANVDMGHCAKTLEIIKFAYKDIEHRNKNLKPNDTIHWLFLADDDTLLSVPALAELLACFNPHNDIYLGERYGYRLHASDGFNYITGGGGIAFSLSVIKQILIYCTCPSKSAPDDMIIGSCLHNLQVNAIHTARFHQANSKSYANEILHVEAPISFHKFLQIDPLMEYQRWFAAYDVAKKKLHKHTRRSNHILDTLHNITLPRAQQQQTTCEQGEQQVNCLENDFSPKNEFMSF